jgi:hypothetical protein
MSIERARRWPGGKGARRKSATQVKTVVVAVNGLSLWINVGNLSSDLFSSLIFLLVPPLFRFNLISSRGGVVGQQIAAVSVRCVVESVHNNNAPAVAAAAGTSLPLRAIFDFESLNHLFNPAFQFRITEIRYMTMCMRCQHACVIVHA